MSDKVGITAVQWQKIFNDHNLLERINRDGVVEISAKLIRKYREARLMAKFDHANNEPPIFSNNGISILPISRGSYVLGRFKVFHRFEDSYEAEVKEAPYAEFDSVQPQSITSEAVALNYAYSCGIIADFVGEKVFPTVSGRMGSGDFSFRVSTTDGSARELRVSGAQIEIDAGYEGASSVVLVEAKMALSDDFHIRQLYFPYRVFQARVRKNVRPVFMTFSNGVYTLSEYTFDNLQDYNSIRLLQRVRYQLLAQEASAQSIVERLQRVQGVPSPQIPFPQADSFERVINLLELSGNEPLLKSEIHSVYDFTPRQSDYYFQAGQYLGLLEIDADKLIYPSALGRKILAESLEERQILLAEQLMKFAPFRLAIQSNINGGQASKSAIARSIADYSATQVGETTAHRRAVTVQRWAAWVAELLNPPLLSALARNESEPAP